VHTMKRAALAAVAVLALFVAGCNDGNDKPQKSEAKIRDDSYARLAANQPAHTMQYSPTRDQINFWIDTWGKEPGKTSYVYIQNASGKITGYYVFKGLPVSYCAALTPTYRFEGTPHDGSDALDQQVPAPSVDGVYYGNSGALCGTYYGRDETTNQYVEYTVGQSQNVLVYEKPIPRQDLKPLGYTRVKNGKTVKAQPTH
jgi:hypothetical protein